MTLVLSVVAVLILAYVGFVLWIMRQPVEFVYYGRLSPILHWLLGPQVVCISLWTKAILLYPPSSPLGRVHPQLKRHEFDGHILNPDQWAGHPFTFPFLYLWEQLWHGYDRNKYEQAARRIAGEPLR